LRVAVAFGIALIVLNRLGARLAATVFDRERLITSVK
jgi:hypothetical protein